MKEKKKVVVYFKSVKFSGELCVTVQDIRFKVKSERENILVGREVKTREGGKKSCNIFQKCKVQWREMFQYEGKKKERMKFEKKINDGRM